MKIENKELGIVKAQTSKAVTAAEALVVKDLTLATEVLSKIKAVSKLTKEKKEKITKPLNEALKNARDLFRPLEESLESAEQIVKAKMVAYSNEIEEKNRIEEEKIAKKVEEGKMSFNVAAKKVEAMKRVEPITTKNGTAEFRTHKLVVVENPSLVPDEYWEINTTKLRKDVLAGIVVPGTKIVEEKIVAGYSKQTEEYVAN